MKWTKLNKQLEETLCDKLKNRVKYFVTCYRRSHDQLGRATILVDGKEVINMCTITSEMKEYRIYKELINTLDFPSDMPYLEKVHIASDKATLEAYNCNIYGEYEFYEAVKFFLNNSIEVCLESGNRLIKILALVDRRVGKRKLYKLRELMEKEDSLVKYFYYLRLSAENM